MHLSQSMAPQNDANINMDVLKHTQTHVDLCSRINTCCALIFAHAAGNFAELVHELWFLNTFLYLLYF